MKIRSVAKKLDMAGLQGSLSFDNTKLNANTILYNKLRVFMESERGMGGSGGDLANRLKNPKHFQQSNVFGSAAERDAVAARLNKELEEYLQSTIGKQAKAQNMSTHQFLASQGIHNVGYRNDDFIKASMNPLRGSVEKNLQAFNKMRGNVSRSYGGTGEGRQFEAYYRPEDLKHARKIVTTNERRLEKGTGNLGDLEALYLPAAQKDEVRAMQKLTQADRAAKLLADEKHPTMMKMKADALKKYHKKELESKAYKELEDEGLIPKKEKEDEKTRKESPASKAAKAAAVTMGIISTTIGTIKTMVGTMVSLLTKISAMMGKITMDAAELGIDTKLAESLKKWGSANPTYTEGNEFILLDAMKSFNSKFGDLTRFDSNANFTSAAFNQYAGAIAPILEASIKKDPAKGTEVIYNMMAQRYFARGTKKEKEDELHTQMMVLTETVDANFAKGYSAMLLSGEKQKWLGKHNAHNMFKESLNEDRLNRLSSGLHLDNVSGFANDAFGLDNNTAALNNVLGDLGKMQHALYMMLLSNMDIIIQILLGISKAILSFMDWRKIPGAKEGLASLQKAEAGMAKQGYGSLVSNSLKFKNDAEATVTSYLQGKGLKDAELSSDRSAIMASLYAGTPLPAKHSDFLKTRGGQEALASMVIHRYSEEKADDDYNSVFKEGRFEGSGNIYNTAQKSYYEILRRMEAEGITGFRLRGAHIERVEGRRLTREQQKKVTDEVTGKNKKIKTVPGTHGFSLMPGYVPDPEEKFERNSPKDFLEQDVKEQQKELMNRLPFGGKKKGASLQYPELLSGIALSSYTASGRGIGVDSGVGSAGGGEPFEIINRVELTLNGNPIVSNVISLAEDSRKRSHTHAIRQSISTPS